MIYQLKGGGGGGGPIIDRSIFGAFQPKPLLRKIKLKVALRKLPFVNSVFEGVLSALDDIGALFETGC